MPIIAKTAKGTVSGLTKHNIMVLNMAKAMALAVGSTYQELTMSVEGHTSEKFYYVPLASIGYGDWCAYFHYYGNAEYYDTKIGIQKMDKNTNSIDLNDVNRIECYMYNTTGMDNQISELPETCVMIHDGAKDTVLFDVHHGSTIHGTDLGDASSSNKNWIVKASFFFAKDTKGGVLCGVGNDSIEYIRTLYAKTFVYPNSGCFDRCPQKNKNFSNVLQLTKMVNYLDVDYPEMKSAYISTIRPIVSSSETKKRVSVYEINGSKWGTVGNTMWDSLNYKCLNTYYFPFNPIVNY